MGDKLSWSEAEAVVRAYRTEQGLSADVEVSTLARTLGTSQAEVRRLAGIKRRFVDRSGVISAGIAFGIVGLLALTFGPFRHRPLPVATLPPLTAPVPTEIVVLTDDGGVYALDSTKDAGPVTTFTYPSDEPVDLAVPDEKTL